MQHLIQRPYFAQPDCFALCLSFCEGIYIDYVPAVKISSRQPAAGQPGIDNRYSHYVAVAKYRKGVSKAVSFIGESLRQLLVDVVSETAKKALFP